MLLQSAYPTRPESKNGAAVQNENGAAVQNESPFRSPRRPTWPHFESPEHKSIAAIKSRIDSSIVPLTKKSNHLLKEYPNQSLNLQQVAKDLGAQRSGIYGLTSVLKGVGMIEKQNVVRCAGALGGGISSSRSRKRKNSDNSSSSDSDGIGGPPKLLKTISASSSPYYDTLCQEIGDLKDEERQLDRFIHHLKSSQSAAVPSGRSQNLMASVNQSERIVNHSQDLVPSSVNPLKHLLYLSYDDIASVTDFTNNTILGIRAPPGTSLEVPDPDRGEMPGVRRFEVCLSSRPSFVSKYKQPQKSDKINIHLIRPSRQNKEQKVPSSQGRVLAGMKRRESQSLEQSILYC
jgi:transcription factor E2F3